MSLLRISPSIQLTCPSHHCYLISAVEIVSLSDPQSHHDRTFFVVNRRRKGELIWNNVQQHDLRVTFYNIKKIDFNITAEL